MKLKITLTGHCYVFHAVDLLCKQLSSFQQKFLCRACKSNIVSRSFLNMLHTYLVAAYKQLDVKFKSIKMTIDNAEMQDSLPSCLLVQASSHRWLTV